MALGPWTRWSNEHYVTIYELARSGLSDRKIMAFFRCNKKRWREWLAQYPDIKKVLARGRSSSVAKKQGGVGETYTEYVYRHLDPALKRKWDEITRLFRSNLATPKRIESILDGGVKERQALYLFALPACHFSGSEACRRVHVDPDEVRGWAKSDPGFKRLLDEVKVQMKDFAEFCLFRGMKEGDSNLIKFVNQTLNADRGYNPAKQLKVEGSVNHLVAAIEVDENTDLSALPLEQRRALLQVIRRKKLPPKDVTAEGEVVDAAQSQ